MKLSQLIYLISAMSIVAPTSANVLTSSQATSYEQEQQSKIDINFASVESLQSLPGIGKNKAQAIVSYRENIGNFSNLEEIKLVKGIGEKLYAKIKSHIKIAN